MVYNTVPIPIRIMHFVLLNETQIVAVTEALEVAVEYNTLLYFSIKTDIRHPVIVLKTNKFHHHFYLDEPSNCNTSVIGAYIM